MHVNNMKLKIVLNVKHLYKKMMAVIIWHAGNVNMNFVGFA